MLNLGMSLDVIVGLQRGDEGKGRFVDLVAGDYAIIARGNGGANAGHTVLPKEGQTPLALHQVPAGIAYPDKLNIIGNGVYVDPIRLLTEIEEIRATGLKVSTNNLLISDGAHVVLPHHKILDTLREEGDDAQGSTKSGIAYVAADKYMREGVRLEMLLEPKLLSEHVYDCLVKVNDIVPPNQKRTTEELKTECKNWIKASETIKPHLADTVQIINDRLKAGEKVLAEGANAYWLDINHGMYPAVTSSSTTVAGLLDGLDCLRSFYPIFAFGFQLFSCPLLVGRNNIVYLHQAVINMFG